MSDYVHVAVGVVRDSHGKILLAKRRDHVHQGGLWEFPGGKVEPGESVQSALRRELREELAIEVDRCRPLIQIRHHYADKSVLLDVREVQSFRGSPKGNEGQPLVWVDARELRAGTECPYPLPAANAAIIKALRLPDVLLITGGFAEELDFLTRLERVLRGGIRLIQVRDSGRVQPKHWEDLLQKALSLAESHGAKLVINGKLQISPAAVHGFHLPGSQLMACRKRPVPHDQLLGASCHNREELLRAAELDADYAVLSPVGSTRSHPEAPSLGWEGFRDLLKTVNLPVYALGGMSREDIARAQSVGGRGIAAISALWEA